MNALVARVAVSISLPNSSSRFNSQPQTTSQLAAMVSAFRAESIRDPTDSLQELYRSYLELGNPSNSFPRFVSEHFANVFRPEHAFQEVDFIP